MQKRWPLFLIVISIFFIEICNELTTTGMFVDGITYDNIAANMAQGICTFWEPSITDSYFDTFRGHPPLAFGLLALCYKAFGIHLWVAKGYSLLMFILSGLLLLRLWTRVGFRREMGWLPLLLWVLVPTVSQYACDNLLEGTMGVFVIASVLCMLHSPSSNSKKIGWHILGGFFLYLAVLTKGVTGLYPLCLPLIIWLVDFLFRPAEKRYTFAQAILYCLIPFLTLALCIVIVGLIQPVAFDYLKEYLSQQIIGGIHEGTVDSRWFVNIKFLERTAILWALAVIILGIASLRNRKQGSILIPKRCWRLFFIFTLLSLSGVVPMMISTKQSDFYILTVFPFIAVAIGALLNNSLEQWLNRRGKVFQRITVVLAVLIVLAAIAMNVRNYGKPGRDIELQQDVELIVAELEEAESIAIPDAMFDQYCLFNYAYRAKRIDMRPTSFEELTEPLPQHLLTMGEQPVPDSLYRPVDIPTHQYKLYEIIK